MGPTMSNEAEIAALRIRVAALESLVIELLEAVGRIDSDEADTLSLPDAGYRLKPRVGKIALPTGPVRRRRQRLIEAAYGSFADE